MSPYPKGLPHLSPKTHCPEGVQAWTEDGGHIRGIGKLMERPIVDQHKIILGGATILVDPGAERPVQ